MNTYIDIVEELQLNELNFIFLFYENIICFDY